MSQDSRPNILILHTDQQRFDTIAALGAGHAITPNLDRLVRRGRVYGMAYSSCPVCMPARHDLLTGATARHHGYWGNSNEVIADYGLATFPRLLTQAGYQTIAVGKMHHCPDREHHGWAHMFLMEELPGCREDDAYLTYLAEKGYGHVRCQHGVRPLFYHTPQPSAVPEEHHGSAWVAHQTIDLIRTERDRPFCIMSSWVGPHPPYYVPERYLEMYRDADIPGPCPLPAEAGRHFPASPENPEPGSLRLRRMREAYFAACTLIDTHIGRVLDALEESGQAGNTIVILMSDHGEMLGDRDGYQKHYPYEGSAHIPMVIAGPGFAPGSRCDRPVVTWDVTATILDAAGVAVPAGHPLAGSSLRADAALPADRIIHYHFGRGRNRYVAAVSGTHKFVHHINGGGEELFDLATDPWEQRNLIRSTAPGVQQSAARLRLAAIAFERTQGDPTRVCGESFIDLPYHAPDKHGASLYPPWSSQQYPRWMNGYSEADLAAIAAEMRRAMAHETAVIHRDPQWRQRAVDVWCKLGGKPEVMEAIFADCDRRC